MAAHKCECKNSLYLIIIIIKYNNNLKKKTNLSSQQTTEKTESGKSCDLAREQRNLRNMRVMVILVIIGALGTVSKWCERTLEELEIRERIKTIQTTLFRSTWILRRVLETCYHSDSNERPSSNTGPKIGKK